MDTYCVYLTTYRGNRLPPFYIGSSSIRRVRNGYRGSVVSKAFKTIWREEIRDNPHLFRTVVVSEHATREDAISREEFLQRSLDILNKPTMYINRTIARGCFWHRGQHSAETLAKMSLTKTGRKMTTLTEADRRRRGDQLRAYCTGRNDQAKKLNATIFCCPHCSQSIKSVGAYTRWHGANCRFKHPQSQGC